MSFREDVYAAVRKIKPGHVATYGEIALMIGRPGAARAVGNALHVNPYEWGSSSMPRELWVPCHRVVAADGSLAAGFGFGGREEQRIRLMAEGVEVVGNKVVMGLIEMIDVGFDFTSDSPGYWDGFWENNDGLGGGGSDPDSASAVLQRYNQELWSKELPNGEKMELALGENGSLSWNGFRFGSDSIITSFRYKRQRALLEQVAESMDDYRGFVEDFLHKTYTIGGEIIFPKHARSINQARGVNPLICDRFDLTLECIRRYYAGVSSPLYEILCGDGRFFDLFGDFRGYVEFFLLQDLVSEDYSVVRFWDGWKDFSDNPIPQTVEGYLEFLEREVEFVGRRGERIQKMMI